MNKNTFYPILLFAGLILFSCEGKENEDYTNAGLTDGEKAHTIAIIDSSLVGLKREIVALDSLSKEGLKKEIQLLREEIKTLKGKK